MAELMAKNTSENHSTSKDYQGKINNFKSVFQSASRNSENYLFNCSYVLSGYKRGNKGKLSDRGCIGSKCSLFKTQDKSGINQNVSDTFRYYPLSSLIFEAMVNLTNEDKEICKSNLLFTIEPKLILDNQVSNQGSKSEKLIESEVLAYLIYTPDIITDYLELFSQGFTTTTDKGLSEYLDYLLTLELPSEATIEAHIDLIREKGIKTIAHQNYRQYQRTIQMADSISSEVIHNTIVESEALLKQSLSDKNLLPVSDKANHWLESMFNEDIIAIPTFSQDLNYLLNGGLARGKLYVLGAPPANGKSTISAQLGDLASSKGFKIGYASYEMSAEQLFTTGLSRLGKINSSLIEGKKYLKDVKLTDKILETFTHYTAQIAPNLHLIEADDLYTPSRLLTIIKKLKLDLLIVDYLQLMTTGDPKLDNAYQETLRVSKIATELKRIARKSNIPIIAISDINKNAYSMAIKGGDLDMSALRDSFKIAHSADVIMLLMSQDVPIAIKNDEGKKAEQMVTQLYLLAEKFREKSINLAQKIEMLAHEYRLEKETADTYSRLIIAKNRTGKCGEVLFRYSKALHYFDAMDYHTDSVNINEDF
jgi:replicative DNA helicase